MVTLTSESLKVSIQLQWHLIQWQGYLKGRFNAGFFALQVLGLIFGNLWYVGHFFILL